MGDFFNGKIVLLTKLLTMINAKSMLFAHPSQLMLCCKNCQGNHLTARTVDIFCRTGNDSNRGVHTKTDLFYQNATIDSNLEGNPSERDNGLVINFDCENCEETTIIRISERKGHTYIERLFFETV